MQTDAGGDADQQGKTAVLGRPLDLFFGDADQQGKTTDN